MEISKVRRTSIQIGISCRAFGDLVEATESDQSGVKSDARDQVNVSTVTSFYIEQAGHLYGYVVFGGFVLCT